jgi:hypothetical protein
MPAWVLTILKGVAVARLRDWLAKNAIKWLSKVIVRSTQNKWDDCAYDVIEAIIDGKPSEEINTHMNKLVKLFDESDS